MKRQPEPAHSPRGDSELEKRARQVGTIAGTVAAVVGGMRRRLDDSGNNLGDQLTDLGRQAKSKVQELRGTAAVRADEWRRAAQRRAVDLGRQTKLGLERACDRANQLAHDYPWHLVVAAGVIGLLVGATLKLRRANRGF
jgi:ElaB/YqjD/DUF883 family membrane-anchored ribosome-binding protein